MEKFTAWELNVKGLTTRAAELLQLGKIDANDIVWFGPDGSAIIAPDASELQGEDVEYVDSGTVSEYLED